MFPPSFQPDYGYSLNDKRIDEFKPPADPPRRRDGGSGFKGNGNGSPAPKPEPQLPPLGSEADRMLQVIASVQGVLNDLPGTGRNRTLVNRATDELDKAKRELLASTMPPAPAQPDDFDAFRHTLEFHSAAINFLVDAYERRHRGVLTRWLRGDDDDGILVELKFIKRAAADMVAEWERLMPAKKDA